MISFKTCFSRPHILPEIELYCPYILNKRPLVLKVVQQENFFLCIRHEELLLCNFSGHLMTRKGNAPFMLCEKLFVESSIPLEKVWIYFVYIHALIGFPNEFGETTKKKIHHIWEGKRRHLKQQNRHMCNTWRVAGMCDFILPNPWLDIKHRKPRFLKIYLFLSLFGLLFIYMATGFFYFICYYTPKSKSGFVT